MRTVGEVDPRKLGRGRGQQFSMHHEAAGVGADNGKAARFPNLLPSRACLGAANKGRSNTENGRLQMLEPCNQGSNKHAVPTAGITFDAYIQPALRCGQCCTPVVTARSASQKPNSRPTQCVPGILLPELVAVKST